MKKSAKTAEFQLLRLIKNLNENSKCLSTDELILVLNALKSICTNKRLMEMLIQSFDTLNVEKINNKNTITQREKQVLQLVGDGLKNTDIALELKLSTSTIETHRKNIRKKLKLSGNDNLFAFALLFNLQYRNGTEDDNL